MRSACVLVITIAACSVSPPTFLCGEWEDCGPGGACEPGTNACSFADESCPTGRRFSQLANDPFREQCVEILPDAQPGALCETSTTCATFLDCLKDRCVSTTEISIANKLGCARCSNRGSGAPLWCWGETTIINEFDPRYLPIPGHLCPNSDPTQCPVECQTCLDSSPPPPTCAPNCLGSDVSLAMGVGDDHVCYYNGRTVCFGNNELLQVGHPNSAFVFAQLADPYDALAGGAVHTCGRSFDRSAVFCWGANDFGQLGGASGPPSATPIRNDPFPPDGGTLVGVDYIAASRDFTCAASQDRVVCWGDAPLGPGPVNALGGGQITALDVGLNHACVIKGGRVVCWGGNRSGQANPIVQTSTIGATNVIPEREFTHVVTGRAHTCAIEVDGSVWCWGDASLDQLRGGEAPGPVRVISDPPAVGPIAAGADVTCTLHADDVVRCWGDVLETGGVRYDEFFVCLSDTLSGT